MGEIVEKELVIIGDEDKEKKVKALRELMEEDKNLKFLKSEDEYLMRFLYCTDFDVEEAYQKMKTFYELLIEYPDWFFRSSPLKKQELLEKNMRVIPKAYDKEGRPLYIVKLANMDPSTMDLLDDVVAMDDIYVETLFQQNFPPSCSTRGLCVLIDVGNFSLKLMKWITPQRISIVVKRIQSMPIKNYRYHIVNRSFTVQAAIKAVWVFLPQNIKESVLFHFTNWETLYEHIDKDALPVEYGGIYEINYDECNSRVIENNSAISRSFEINRANYVNSLVKN